MKRALFVIITLTLTGFHFDVNPIVGRWKIQSYDAIDKIRESPAYIFADEASRNMIEKQFEEILTKGEYDFGLDTLWYTDLENLGITYRRALWQMDNDTLLIQEIDRSYQRQAFIHKLTTDSLVISPILEDRIGDSKIIFTRHPESSN